MSSVRRIAICLVRRPGSVVIGLLVMVLTSVGLLLASVSPASAEPGGVPFTVELTGAAEVDAAGEPNQGDPDGS